ncbi:MAG: NUDIX hydrolase [Lachnospiraceae bacterium]
MREHAFKHNNCIVVFDKTKKNILFCKRKKNPYKGLYNFVGGKVEPEESSEYAAYRELKEETGISRNEIQLFRLMDLTYYQQKLVLEIYVGFLQNDVELVEEVNVLEWKSLSENFADEAKYAGDKNIAHIVEVALLYNPEKNRKMQSHLRKESFCIGVDGCRGGWTAK